MNKKTFAPPNMVLLIRFVISPTRKETYITAIYLLICYLIGDLFYLLGVVLFLLGDTLHRFYQTILLGSDEIQTFIVLYIVYGFLGWLFYVMTIKYIRDLKGLFTFANAPSQEAAYRALKRTFFLYLPTWLSAEILKNPTPSTVLDLTQNVQTVESTSEAWSQQALLMIAEQNETSPGLRVRLSFTKNLVITLLDQDGKRETISVSTPSWVALLAYLALQIQGEWIKKEPLLRDVYGEIDEKKFVLLRMHIQRIQKMVTEKAREAGMLPFTRNGETQAEVVIIEDSGREKERAWRLSPFCEIEEYARITTTHTLLKAIQENPRHRISLPYESLNRMCEEAYDEYGAGFLSSYGSLLEEVRWLRTTYIKYRNMCLFLLERAATEALLQSEIPEASIDEQSDAQSQAAKYYGWHALVASGSIPISGCGEVSLQESLLLYRKLQDIIAARMVVLDYKKQRKAKWSEWKPSSDLQRIWPEALRRSRKQMDEEDE